MTRIYVLSMVLATILVGGCGQGDDRLVEKAKIEGEAGAEAALTAENENLATKARAMEADLARLHRFYQAVKGTFEGTLQTEAGAYKIKIVLAPSLPPYTTDRVRQLDEIVSDLNNLHLKVQVVQWHPSNPLSAVGCRVENIKPDTINGEVTIASENCANLYALTIAADGVSSVTDHSTDAGALAHAVLSGNVDKVNAIRGDVHPSTNASVYPLIVRRK
ncbi:MAG: hypothetical protein IT285_13705 [Bdellovibrionales bacterium]|nr:hypothetical protein [Bdellovibrionales bacterium]